MFQKKIFNRGFYEVSGCIHNHSNHSFDSPASVQSVLDAAYKNRLDYVTFNEHNTLSVKDDPALQKISNDLIVIVGVEINDRDENHHLLVFNTNEVLADRPVEEYLKHYKEHGAVTFAAHPNEKRVSVRFRKYEWLHTETNIFDGIEIWNYASSWVGKLNPKINGLLCLLFPALFIRKPLRKNLNFLDELNNHGLHKFAIGSSDAHSLKYRLLWIKLHLLTHKTLFRAIRTNALIPTSEKPNEASILNALQNGHSYVVNYRMGIPYNFYAGICDDAGNSTIFGDSVQWKEGLRFYFNLSQISDIVLYHNGVKSAKKHDRLGFFPIFKPGHYRLEISRFRYGWIYTNPIFVIKPEE